MSEIITILAVPAVTWLTQKLRKYEFFKGEEKKVVAFLAIVLGIGIASFQTFLPIEIQESLLGFVTVVFSGSVACYEVIKPFINKK